MDPSVLFWIDTSTSTVISVAALVLFLLILGAGLRQRANQTFGLFAVCASLIGLGSAVANLSFWVDSQTLLRSEGFGNAIFWMELATVGFFMIGPALFTFSIAYTDNVTRSLVSETSERTAAPLQRSRARWETFVAIAGFLIGLALLPAIFNHDIITRIHFDQANLVRWELSSLGYVASTGALLFEMFALIQFWRNRHHSGASALATGTAIWLIGSLVVVTAEIPFPIKSLTLGISVIITGYVAVNNRILIPIKVLTERLEVTVADRISDLQRTRDRLQRTNDQLHRITQISREIAQFTDTDAILTHLVDTIHNRLGYHHIYVYQPDDTGLYLVVRAAAGTTARTVMESRHRLRIGGRSLVGQVAADHLQRIAEARDGDAERFGDTALPGAQAEMTLPLLVGTRLLGVLDLQSIHLGAFSDEDLGVLRNLADQVAAAINNAQRFQETESALAAAENTQRKYVQQTWKSVIGEPEQALAFVYTDGGGVKETNLSTVWAPDISQAVASGHALSSHTDHDRAVVALPITLRGQIIGALQLRRKLGAAWTPEDIDTLSQVAERLGLALETARLSDETIRRAAREQTIAEVSARMRESLDVDTILQTAAREIGEALRLHDVTIQLEVDGDQMQ